MAQQYGLGRGLSSLIPEKKASTQGASSRASYHEESDDVYSRRGGLQHKALPAQGESVYKISTSKIHPNKNQPRKHFDDDKLKELAESIKQYGIIQPLVVTDGDNDGEYELIAGERRLRASKIAGLSDVPVIIRETQHQEKLELAILENIQRHDLNPIEEGRAYKRLVDEFGMHQDDVADKMGKSRSAIANKLRLLQLPIEIQKALEEERITEGHAKAILALDNPEKQRALFDLIVKSKLTVRQAEERSRQVSVRPHKRNITQDPQLKAIEDELSESLSTKVEVKKQGDGAQVAIHWYSRKELLDFINRLH